MAEKIAVGVFLGVLLGLLLDTAERTLGTPIHYAQAEEAPRVILIGTTTPEQSIEEKIRATFTEEPERALAIAKCESGMNAKARSKVNKDGTTDGGLFQINSVHDARLKELGLDKFNADDNIKFAKELYDESRWRPWACRAMVK